MNTKLAALAIEFVAASSALNDRLMGEVQANRAREKQAADKRQAVLELLLSTGGVAQHQKQAAAEMLNNPAQTLDLLVNAVNKMHYYKTASEKAAADLGQAVPDHTTVKAAGVRDSLNDPYVGRLTSEKKASDMALMAVLNGPSRS